MAYMDVNSDVGGTSVNRPDDVGSDGFEKTIFDLSQGVYPEGDPDLVWVRQTTDSDLPAVEIAFEKWIFNDGKVSFMWGVNTDEMPLIPLPFIIMTTYTA